MLCRRLPPYICEPTWARVVEQRHVEGQGQGAVPGRRKDEVKSRNVRRLFRKCQKGRDWVYVTSSSYQVGEVKMIRFRSYFVSRDNINPHKHSCWYITTLFLLSPLEFCFCGTKQKVSCGRTCEGSRVTVNYVYHSFLYVTSDQHTLWIRCRLLPSFDA